MRVIVCEAEKRAYVKEIGDSLEEMQKVVGGYIEAIYPFEEEVCIVCNDEGKIIGLPLNRALKDEDGEILDIVCGTFFIADCSGENFASLTPEDEKKFLEKFKYPEMFMRANGRIVAIPVR